MVSVLWCAEIGSSHQGDKSLCYELVRKAAWAGADLVKFQLGWTEQAQLQCAGNHDSRRYIDHWAEEINDWCNRLDVEFFASIWSFEGLEVARKVGMKRYKIAHQMNDEKLTDAICADGKEVFWSMLEASSSPAKKHTWSIGGVRPVFTSGEYPTYAMSRVGGSGNGYSSHVHGIADALIAVAHGVEFVEKHLTLYKYSGFPRDASFALTPEEFRLMVDVGNEMVALR